MQILRRFTTETSGAYGGLGWGRIADLGGPGGAAGLALPSGFSRAAASRLVAAALEPARVPRHRKRCPEADVPAFLWRSVPDEAALATLPPEARFGPETSAEQIFDRMTGAWAYWGWKAGHFTDPAEAAAYRDEMAHMLARQMAAPEALQWRHAGLHWAYGIETPLPAGGGWHAGAGGAARPVLPAEGRAPVLGQLLMRAAAEPLAPLGLFARALAAAPVLAAGGSLGLGVSALPPAAEGAGPRGLMAQLRAADGLLAAPQPADCRICLDLDHADHAEFIGWKGAEDHRLAALVTGAEALRHQQAALQQAAGAGAGLVGALEDARAAGLPDGYLLRLRDLAAAGADLPDAPLFETDWDSPARTSLRGQHSATALRLPAGVLDRVEAALAAPAPGASPDPALALWRRIVGAVWATGDPAVVFAAPTGSAVSKPGAVERLGGAGLELRATRDCALAGAEINLAAFWGPEGFDLAGYRHAIRLWVLTLDIALDMSWLPDAALAEGCAEARPLGLGIGNLAGLLMRMGLGYDSPEGRRLAAGLAACLTTTGLRASAELAALCGACRDQAAEAGLAALLEQIGQDAAHRAQTGEKDFNHHINKIFEDIDSEIISDVAHVLHEMPRQGLRHSQISLIAAAGLPTDLMDCDSPGLEPLADLIAETALADGGFRRGPQAALTEGLASLGHDPQAVAAIEAHLLGHGSLAAAPDITPARLRALGFDAASLARLDAAVARARDLSHVFTPWLLGLDFCHRLLGLPVADLCARGFDLLAALGFNEAEIAAANAHVCGRGSLMGAPHLRPGEAAVFACGARLAPPGGDSVGLGAEAHLAMAAAVQRGLSGGVAKRLILPREAGPEAVSDLLRRAGALGLKAVVIEREGQSLSRPVDPAEVLGAAP